MTRVFHPRPGVVFSADIAVADPDTSKRFYGHVLTSGTAPLWRDDLMNRLGHPIVGIGPRTEQTDHLPTQWMPHIQVADVAEVAAQAVALGGRELMHHKAEDGTSQWAVLEDPQGAAFGILPTVDPKWLPDVPEDEPPFGHIAWLDLTVAAAENTRDFYQQVIGWTAENVAMTSEEGTYADYAMHAGDGGAVAGVCHARGINAPIPPVWMLCLPVGDLAESLQRAQAGGGSLIHAMHNDDGVRTYAVIQDPAGAYIALAPA